MRSGSSPAGIKDFLQSPHLPALDGLRAVFVLLVVLYHGGLPLSASLGVSGFFVLSGFLITLLLLREQAATGTISLKGFYARRALRIFPAYYAFLGLSVAVDLVMGDTRIVPAILPGLLYLINYYNAAFDHPSISIAHAWSLAVEEQFYLLWPVLLLWLLRWGTAAVARALVLSICAVVVWRCIAWKVLGFGSAYLYNAFESRFDSLAIGCLLAIALSSGRLDRVVRGVTSSWSLPLVIAILLGWTSRLGGDFRYTVGFTVQALLLAILLVQLMVLSRGRVWGWLEWQPVRYMGRISYGIYLYHILGLAIGRKLAGDESWVALLLGVAVTTLMAALSFHLMESRLLAYKDRFSPRAAGVRSGRPA